VDFEGVVACIAIAGAEKLNHRLRKRAIGRTACLGLSSLIKKQWDSVLWGSIVMFVRLDYRWTALVSRNCQCNDATSLGVQRQTFHGLHTIVSGNTDGIEGLQQYENTRIYKALRLDSFWEAMVSSLGPA
jgi:hypothetical protein